jgi:monoamine oxidase
VRVVVVGAGMAGLTATRLLRAAGADVALIEGGPRAGGRVRSLTSPFTAGRVVETGAEWVDTDHHRMNALLRRFGIELTARGQEWTAIRRYLFHEGRLLGADQLVDLDRSVDHQLGALDEAFEAIGAGIADPSRPDLHPDAARHDARSVADLMAELDLGRLAALFAQRNTQGEFAEEPSLVSALFVAQQRAQMTAAGVDGVVRAHRVVGGLSGLVRCLVGELDEQSISFGETVEAVSWRDDSVDVTTDRRTIAADHVVFACSLVPLRSIRFDPVLPAEFGRAVAELGYGTVTKTAVQFAEHAWPNGYATTDLASQRIYETTEDQGDGPPVLMAYTGGNGGRRLAERDEAARVAIVVDDIRTMYGVEATPIAATSRAWSNEPRFGGAYAAYRPGQVTAFWQTLREPCGPIHLAGEHVATWTGYLEGAVESGESVAARLLEL